MANNPIYQQNVARDVKVQTTRDAFLTFWEQRYPQTPPIPYLFKHNLANRWARIHSLPLAKRYAQTHDEWSELLSRHNDVIDHLIPQETEVRIVTTSAVQDNYILEAFAPVADLGMFLAGGEDDRRFHGFEFTKLWQRNCLNPLLTMMAEDQVRAFIIGPDCLIAPYDGGIDVILPSPSAREAFKCWFPDWISNREDGL